MEPLIIQTGEITPGIIFDPNTNFYEITGESRPESVREFYQPVLDWLENYATELKSENTQEEKPSGIVINFKLEYFNSSSAKYFLDIIKSLISNFYSMGIDIKVHWHFEEGDEDMQEAGEELSHMVKFPFKYLPVKLNYSE